MLATNFLWSNDIGASMELIHKCRRSFAGSQVLMLDKLLEFNVWQLNPFTCGRWELSCDHLVRPTKSRGSERSFNSHYWHGAHCPLHGRWVYFWISWCPILKYIHAMDIQVILTCCQQHKCLLAAVAPFIWLVSLCAIFITSNWMLYPLKSWHYSHFYRDMHRRAWNRHWKNEGKLSLPWLQIACEGMLLQSFLESTHPKWGAHSNISVTLFYICTQMLNYAGPDMQFLEEELGLEALMAMGKIKQALDPSNLMNPGKVIPERFCY